MHNPIHCPRREGEKKKHPQPTHKNQALRSSFQRCVCETLPSILFSQRKARKMAPLKSTHLRLDF